MGANAGTIGQDSDVIGLAATAQVNDLVVVTRNTADFQGRASQSWTRLRRLPNLPGQARLPINHVRKCI
ncbi:hypothetical protein RTCIAT899_PB02460 (plasmid) [Rhizobium tropici CIAT 899]|nr:hypothetical protein RTCIAT899_PB02460 [Rhizobium tropici CIAT 899]